MYATHCPLFTTVSHYFIAPQYHIHVNEKTYFVHQIRLSLGNEEVETMVLPLSCWYWPSCQTVLDSKRISWQHQVPLTAAACSRLHCVLFHHLPFQRGFRNFGDVGLIENGIVSGRHVIWYLGFLVFCSSSHISDTQFICIHICIQFPNLMHIAVITCNSGTYCVRMKAWPFCVKLHYAITTNCRVTVGPKFAYCCLNLRQLWLVNLIM